MKARYYFIGVILVAAVILAIMGFFKGAGVALAIATAMELLASVLSGKRTNI